MTPRTLQILVFLVCVGVVLSQSEPSDSVIRIEMSVRLDSYNQPSKVTLTCKGGTLPATYWRRVDDSSPWQRLDLVGPDDSSGKNQVRFEITPSLEGLYYCQIGNVTSVNHLEIVAYPLQNLTIAAMKKVTANVGESVTLSCVYDTPGVLKHRYHIEWYIGQEAIVNADTPLPKRYTVSDKDFSLTILNATIQDSSDVYYCALRVENLEVSADIYTLGPTFALEVQSPLKVTEDLEDVVFIPNTPSLVKFSCAVSGSPEPTITWTVQGKDTSELGKTGKFREEKIVYSTSTAIHVSSQLTVQHVEVADTGEIVCVAISGPGSAVVTSRARLVVLPSDFKVEVQALQEGSAVIRADFPTTIPGVFSLVVRYIESAVTSSDAQLFDVQFSDTNKIDYEIPREKLPRFTTFRVRVALKVGRVQGDFSPHSNQITISLPDSEGGTTGAVCDSNSDETDLVTVWVPVVIVAVAVIVVTGAAGTVIIVYFCRHRDSKKPPGVTNSYYADHEESVRSSRSNSRVSDGEYEMEVTSFNSQQLAERERRKVIGEVPIMEMSNEDLFSTLPRSRRAPSEDADMKSIDFATPVPYHS